MSKSFSLNIEQNSSHCKHKGERDHNKHTLEDYKYCLENNEIKNGVNYAFRSIKQEITMVKQKQIVLHLFDDKRCLSINIIVLHGVVILTLKWLRKQ